MSGAYAKIMQTVQKAGRWPESYVTLMLHYNTMKTNYLQELHTQNQLMTPGRTHNGRALASCHPNAIMFMNIACDKPYPNDETKAVMVKGRDAEVLVRQGQGAVVQANKAIWVKYGSAEEHSHSIVLLTGTSPQIESLEGWAGDGAHVYFFHESVYDGKWQGPSQNVAQSALGNLIADDGDLRKEGWNLLSRSGADYAPGAGEVPYIFVAVRDMVDQDVFRARVKKRLQAVSFYKARALYLEAHYNPRLACCHCQSRGYRSLKSTWRECTVCFRQYCGTCARLVLSGDTCDCNHQTKQASEQEATTPSARYAPYSKSS